MAERTKVKVIVVDDSAFMRKILSDLICSDGRCEVIAKATNGIEALKLIKELKPDVITVDVEMPKMNGIELLRELYKEVKVPAIMVSAITKEGADVTIEALHLGAVDFITKPDNIFNISTDTIKKHLINKVVAASRISLRKLTRVSTAVKSIEQKKKPRILHKEDCIDGHCDVINQCVCIGTSTGGPKALQIVLSKLHKGFNAPIFVVQHMPMGFTASLANRLNSMSDILVKEAEDGETVRKGIAYIAPGGQHMSVRRVHNQKYRIVLDGNKAPIKGHRPAYDETLASISQEFREKVVGVIMTGMGSDGAEGLERLKRDKQAYIIAEDKESCVVYGMPKAVIDKKIADDIAVVEEIAKILNEKIGVI